MPSSVSRAMVTRPLSGEGSRTTQPCCSSRATTWERRESEELTIAASVLIGSVRPGVSESMAIVR